MIGRTYLLDGEPVTVILRGDWREPKIPGPSPVRAALAEEDR